MNSATLEVQKPNPLLYLFGKTWQYSAGNRQNVVWYWTMFIVANTFLLVLNPLVLAKIMDVIQKEGITQGNFGFLSKLLLGTLVLDILFWGFHGPGRVIECVNGFKVRGNYRKHLLRVIMTRPLEWHADHHSGDTIDKIEKGTSALYTFSTDSFQIISSVVQLVVSYVMLTYFSPPAALIVLSMLGVTIWITMRFDRLLVREYTELNRMENKVAEGVYDSVSNIATVIILRVEGLVFEAISKKIMVPLPLFYKNNVRNEIKWFLINVCCTVMTIAVLMVYFWQSIHSTTGVLIGSVFLLFKYLDTISNLFFRFCGMYGDILQQTSKVNNAEELTKGFKAESLTDHVLPPDWKLIEVRNLQFSYQNNGTVDLHLHNISFDMRHGERIAFVGVSGSGKTTMLKVMRNLYRPQGIELSVDGRPIDGGFDGISRAIALVPQDPEIFATTIGENITLGAEYDPAVVRQFTDMACFTDVAEALPNKLESAINEKGVNLSGGQRQRLALARGLLACNDKSIVLLDEPTSSVDIGNEMLIYRNIFGGFKGKTVVSSIHRLHLLPLFDRIIIFESGKIVGNGTLDELLESCPQFQSVWRQYREHNETLVS